MIIYKDERDPAMLYESIARYAFDCGRAGDPDQIADAGFFDANFVPPLTEAGLNAMCAIIDQLKTKTNNNKKLTEYSDIKDSLALDMDQENSIQLLGLLADIIND